MQLVLTFGFGLASGKMFDKGWFHYMMMGGSMVFGMGYVYPNAERLYANSPDLFSRVFILSFMDPAKYIQVTNISFQSVYSNAHGWITRSCSSFKAW